MHKHEWKSEDGVFIHPTDSGAQCCFKHSCACGQKGIMYWGDIEEDAKNAQTIIISETEWNGLKKDTRF